MGRAERITGIRAVRSRALASGRDCWRGTGESLPGLFFQIFRVVLQTLSRLLCAWINRFSPALSIMGPRFAICATFWRRRRSFDYLSTARSDEAFTALNATWARIWGRRNTCGVRTPLHPKFYSISLSTRYISLCYPNRLNDLFLSSVSEAVNCGVIEAHKYSLN